MSFFEKAEDSSVEKNNVSDLIYSMITADQLSSICATPDDEDSTSGTSTNNDDFHAETPISTPADEPMTVNPLNFGTGNPLNFETGNEADALISALNDHQSSKSGKSDMDAVAAAAAQHSLLPNGKKTKGRVKIKMEFIDNKLRRYTTFSKRKTGIMKKAYELSTLTGTQVMLLVASETGHVYTFATKKLQPMITSDAGKALIQTCLNSTESGDGLPQFGETSSISANFHTSEIASLTPASLLFSSTIGNGSANGNQSQQRPSTNANSAKRSQKSNQQHCSDSVESVLARAMMSSGNLENGTVDDLSILKDLGASSAKSSSKGSYYNASELPTMVPPSSSSRFTLDGPSFFPQPEPTAMDEDLRNGDLSLSTAIGASNQVQSEPKGNESSKMVNGNAKRRPCGPKHGSTPSSSIPGNSSASAPAGSTLNNILHNIVASRQQQKQAASSMQTQNQFPGQQLQHQNRRKRPTTNTSAPHVANKHANIFGQTTASTQQQSSNPTSLQQLGSQLFPFAGLLPGATSTNNSAIGSSTANQQPFGLFPGLGNGAFIYPPGIVYAPTPVSLPEGAAAAFALQQMLASVMAASNNSNHVDGQRVAQHQPQNLASGNTQSPAAQPTPQSLIPLSLPFSMMTANYLAQRHAQGEDFEDGDQMRLDEEESD